MPDRKYTYKVEIDASQAKAQAAALRQQMTADLDAIEQRKASTAQAAEVRKRAQADDKAMLDSIRRAKQQVERQEAEQKRLTAATEREAKKRAAAEERASRQAEVEARRVVRSQEAEQRRLTASTEREARKRAAAEARAAREAARTTRASSFSLGGAWNNLDMMTSMAAGGLAGFGLAQIGQSAYGAGETGAQLIRQQSTFTDFSARMGQDANEIIAAVRRASRATITEFDAMGLASQVLASKFASNSGDIAGDLETVTAASRRFSQIYVDKESGQSLSTQEIFSRMIGYAREGNKELIDQFNITNQTIADAMKTNVEAFSGADGATLRWQGLIKVLNSELERLGPAAVTAADRYEQSTAKIADARQRFQMALAGPMAGFGEGVANVAEGGVTLTGNAPMERVRSMVQTRQVTGNLPVIDAGAYERASSALRAYDSAMKVNSATASTYAENLRAVLNDLVNQGRLSQENEAQLGGLTRQLALVAQKQDAYTLIMAETTQQGIEQNAAIFGLVRAMGDYERMVQEGTLTVPQYTALMGQLATQLGLVAEAAGFAAPALGAVNAAAGNTPYALAMAAKNEKYATYDGYNYGAVARRIDAAAGSGGTDRMLQAAAATEANKPYTAEGQEALRLQLVLDLQKQAAAEERQATAAAAKEWESAAKKTAAEFEAAAEAAAAAFESALRNVPGLFGTSEVTGEQMAGAAAGVPQEFADNYLRRLADEVAGAKDWEGIDIQDAARRAGVDPGLPKDIILQQVRGAWEDSSLFSGGRNTDLITNFGGLDAIKANLTRQDASASGEQALTDFLAAQGLGPATGGKDAAQAQAMTTIENAPDDAKELVEALQAAFASETVTSSLQAVGENTIAAIHGGYARGAGRLGWSGPLVSAVTAQVLDQLTDVFNRP